MKRGAYLRQHPIRVGAKIRIELSVVCGVQILLNEARGLQLLLRRRVQNVEWFFGFCLHELDLFQEVATLLFAGLLVAARLHKQSGQKTSSQAHVPSGSSNFPLLN